MLEQFESGLNVIDEKVGGLYNSSTYLVTGNTGTGKSILGLQFLMKGISKYQNGLLITDERPKNVVLQAESLGFDIRNAITNGNLIILELTEKYSSYVQSLDDLKDMYEEIDNCIAEHDIKRVVVDGFKTICVPNNDIQLAKEFLPFFFDKLSSGELTSIITADITNATNSDEAKNLLERLATGIIHLHQSQTQSLRHLIIRKMKGTPVESKPFDYFFVNNKGIVGKEQQ